MQAIPGYILLIMPIIYGVSGQSPFDTKVQDFFLYFTPFIVSAMLPTLISANWRGIDANKLQRDEQVGGHGYYHDSMCHAAARSCVRCFQASACGLAVHVISRRPFAAAQDVSGHGHVL